MSGRTHTAYAQSARCPRCRAENFSYAAFCIGCGEPLDDPAASGEGLLNEGAPPSGETRPPATGPSRAVLLRWEMWVGVCLVAALLGFVLYDWGNSTVQSNAYRDGVAAAERHDWDRAAESFSQAGDLHESSRRAEEARRKVADRNRLYSAGVEAGEHGDWPGAVAALKGVGEIQPAYRDSASRLSAAKEAAFQEGLDGLAYLVTGGPDPGLYIREAGQARKLPGSDRGSLLRAVSADGKRLVYDVPAGQLGKLDFGAGENAPAIQPTILRDAGRLQVLAAVTTEGAIDLPAAPELGDEGYGLFDESGNGLWWYGSPTVGGSFGREVFYYSLSDRTVGSVTRHASRGQSMQKGTVVAVDPQHGRVVLVEGGEGAAGEPRTARLSIARADGGQKRQLAALPGDVHEAQISSDGLWLLLTTQENGDLITRSVWLLPLDASAAKPRLLSKIVWGGSEMNARLSAVFLPHVGGQSEVLVNRVLGDDEMLAMYISGDPSAVYVIKREAEHAYRPDSSGLSHNGNYLAGGRRQGGAAQLELISLPPGTHFPASVRLPAANTQIVSAQFSPQDGYVVASVQNPEGINRGTTQTLYAAPVGKDGSLGTPRRIAVARLSYSGDTPAFALPPGGTFLAYIGEGGQLRAALYNGLEDRIVAEHVGAVWSLQDRPGLLLRR